MQFESRHVKHAWRNRIGINSSVISKDHSLRKWRRSVHYVVTNYMRLYTSIINYSTYILVSHRDMISAYAMDNGATDGEIGNWIDSVQFSDGHIRTMFLKKRPKKDREEQLE